MQPTRQEFELKFLVPSDRMKPVWTIVEYKGREGLLRLSADWTRLVSAMPDAGFQHLHETHVGYFDNYPSPFGDFTCLALSDGMRVRAIFPAEPQRTRILGRETLVWGLPIGLGDVPRDVICPPDDEAELAFFPCVVEYLSRAHPRRRWFVLTRVLEGSAAWRCLRALDARSYCTDWDGAAHIVDCDRPFDELTSTLSRKFRQNLRTAHGRLNATADHRFEHAADPARVATAFEDFLRVESSGWKGHDGTRTAVALRPSLLAFLRQFASLEYDAGRCELLSLHAAGRCIASTFCIRVGRELAVLKIAYDEEYARVSPGQVLMEYVLQESCADPAIEQVNFLGDAAWTRVWHPEPVGCHNAYVSDGDWAARRQVSILRARYRYGPAVKRWLLRSRYAARLVQRLRGTERERDLLEHPGDWADR